MNNKLLLVKGITLLYRESQLSGNKENSSALVRQVLSEVKVPEVSLGVDHERDILIALKATALEMCDAPLDHEWDKTEMLQRLKVNCDEDTVLYEGFREGIEAEMAEVTLKKFCLNLRKALKNYFNENKVNEFISKASYRLKFEREKITDMKKFVAEVVGQLEPFQVDADASDPAVISEVNMSDLNAVAKIFQGIKEQSEGHTILRTGYQGINRMLDGGFRLGETWVIGALQHQYKSGFSLTIFKQIALYNIPTLKDPTKKPLLLRISFEDDLKLNFQFLYANLKENETGQVMSEDDLKNIPAEELASYVNERLSVNGWYTHFMFVNPSDWTYRDVINKIIELESQGYEVQLCMLDYLLKLPTTGCDQGPMGHDIRNLYERLRNFFAARSICFITPHQLSTEAKQLVRDGSLDFVKKINGGGYYAGCKQIDQVVDGELYIHIEKLNNESQLTIQRGKHRKIKQTPWEYLYAVLPFVKGGGIRDDINGADTTRKKVGGGAIGTADEVPFWDVMSV